MKFKKNGTVHQPANDLIDTQKHNAAALSMKGRLHCVVTPPINGYRYKYISLNSYQS
ncbi:MAG: hypothetical protein LBT09_03615 [Planctomycetaceae bacterium]|nr:hypothetical protein [Planctomycetaceae bacterium]